MVPPSTYLEFHLVFLVPAIAVLFGTAWIRGRLFNRAERLGAGLFVALAVAYTTAWDNYLISRDVWSYGEGVVWAAIWLAPAGEYLFFVLQPVIVVLFLSHLSIPTDTGFELSWRDSQAGIVGGLLVSTVGLALVLAGDSGLYLGATLLWAGPILAVQWGFGWRYLWHVRRPVTTAVVIPTVYLWVVDWTAISLGLWTISDTHTLGIGVAGFPLEEAAFFVLTTLFIVQGFVLYRWLVEHWSRVISSSRFGDYRQYAAFLGLSGDAGDQ